MLDVDGAVVATYTMEPAEAPARADVVLCHGTPWSAAVWAPVARALSDTHRVFLWDMPGYGQSITDTPAKNSVIYRNHLFRISLFSMLCTSGH